jgi:ABC-type thiamin/hydroxymethylpyrimidine transport system permease subunit
VKRKRFLSSFSVFDIIVTAMCAGLGIAVKPVVSQLAHIITGPLFIPGGAVAGGLYMLFIVLAASLTGRPGAATLACAVQAILVVITGVMGSHGIMSLVTYVLPGVLADAYFLMTRKHGVGAFSFFFMGMIANVTGTFLSNAVFFNLPFVPLMLPLFSGALSGGLGGLVAWAITKELRKLFPAFRRTSKDSGEKEATDEK